MNLKLLLFVFLCPLLCGEITAQCDIVWKAPSPFCDDATEIDFYSRCFITNDATGDLHEPNRYRSWCLFCQDSIQSAIAKYSFRKSLTSNVLRQFIRSNT